MSKVLQGSTFPDLVDDAQGIPDIAVVGMSFFLLFTVVLIGFSGCSRYSSVLRVQLNTFTLVWTTSTATIPSVEYCAKCF